MVGLCRLLRQRVAQERGMWETDVFLSDEDGALERTSMERAYSKWWLDVPECVGEPVERVGVLDFGYLCSYVGEVHHAR